MVGAMLQQGGACRAIIRLCLLGELVPLIGVALFSEMEDMVLSRLRSGPSTHLCGLSFECQWAFAT